MNVNLQNRVVIVTGGGGAIGSAMCREFAKNGAIVIVADITKAKQDEVVSSITAVGGQAYAVYCDVTSKECTQAMVDEVVDRYGRIDCLVNNAGINGGPNQRKPIYEYDDELWHNIINVDLNGVYYCSKPVILQMQKQGTGGSIINIGSVTGLTPLRLQCAFTAAKAGVFNLSKAMALELAPLNIRVNAIAPGSILFEGTRNLFYVDAEKAEAILSHIPQHRPGTPEEIAAMTCFLASDDASYMTGSVVTIDGGWTCGYTRDF